MSRNQATVTANHGAAKFGQKVGKATPKKVPSTNSTATQAGNGLWKKTGTLEQALDTIDRKTR